MKPLFDLDAELTQQQAEVVANTYLTLRAPYSGVYLDYNFLYAIPYVYNCNVLVYTPYRYNYEHLSVGDRISIHDVSHTWRRASAYFVSPTYPTLCLLFTGYDELSYHYEVLHWNTLAQPLLQASNVGVLPVARMEPYSIQLDADGDLTLVHLPSVFL